MKPDQWRQIDKLFHAALERESTERSVFLANACASDEFLRREVESLLASHDQGGISLDACDLAADLLQEGQVRTAVGRTIGTYKILKPLGEGGMGDVFLVQDARLGREIALKLLPAEFTWDRHRLQRFEQEARAASALNHPNIVTIHEIGDDGDLHFIAMEFVDGVTLRERMARGRLKLGEALNVAIQVASALAAAHAARIVHRDIKPENILLRHDGYIKVVDFGLAKLTAPAVNTGAGTIAPVETGAGTVEGTPHYMSPEQVRGVTADCQTDIFSFGAVLYEILTGQRAFQAATAAEVMNSVLKEEPPALPVEIPLPLRRIVARCLEKEPERRFQSARDLAFALRVLTADSHPLHDVADTRIEIDDALAATPRPKGRLRQVAWFLAAALVLCAAALAGLSWWWVQHKSAPIPIAVLPLSNLSEDPANDYFADGLTGEIIRNLSIIDGLAVRSQTSSFAFKGKPRNVGEVGKQLGADYILEGSVQRAGQQLRINIQLVRVRDDLPLWSAKFDRELTDVFAIQDEISRGIVNSLRLKLGRGRRRYETSTEAYSLYLRARALEIQGLPGVTRSIELFDEAIAKDRSFAPAYAGLATAHAIRSLFNDTADEAAKMRAAAEKTIQLDPLLVEAHHALGMVYARDGQWEQSEGSFRRAIECDPGRSMSYSHFAVYLLLPLGRIDEALEQLRLAEKADPLSPDVHMFLAHVLIPAGRYDEAAGHCEKLPADFWSRNVCLGRARLWQGRTGEAIQILETDFNQRISNLPSPARLNHPVQGYLGYACARVGRREDAEKLAAASPQNLFTQALIFAGLGDKDRTFEVLDRATVNGPCRIGCVLATPEYALLRGDPRLKALRKKVGLPE